MMDLIETATQVERRKDILDRGCPLADLDEYNVLTLKLAETVPTLLRAVKDVVALRDELAVDKSSVATVAKAFSDEIDRALKGQR